MNRIDNPTARALLQAVGEEYSVSPALILERAPRDPEIRAARKAAISRMSREMIDGKFRFPIAKLQAWFGVSRASINRARAADPEYEPRQVRHAREA